MKIVKIINADFELKGDKIIDLINNFSSAGIVIKDSRNIVKKFDLNSLKINIKSFKVPNIINSFVYNFFRKGKAERSYVYALKLLSLGINTPAPIAFIEFKNLFFLSNSYYVSEQLKYDFSIREVIKDLKFPERDKILKLFVKFTFKLHENNINYLDHSPGNTLIVKNKLNYDFYLIDLNRMKFEKMSLNKRMQNFERLSQDTSIISIFSKEYSKLFSKDFELINNLMREKVHNFFSTKMRKKRLKSLFD